MTVKEDVLAVLSDGGWHTVAEIAEATGHNPTSVREALRLLCARDEAYRRKIDNFYQWSSSPEGAGEVIRSGVEAVAAVLAPERWTSTAEVAKAVGMRHNAAYEALRIAASQGRAHSRMVGHHLEWSSSPEGAGEVIRITQETVAGLLSDGLWHSTLDLAAEARTSPSGIGVALLAMHYEGLVYSKCVGSSKVWRLVPECDLQEATDHRGMVLRHLAISPGSTVGEISDSTGVGVRQVIRILRKARSSGEAVSVNSAGERWYPGGYGRLRFSSEGGDEMILEALSGGQWRSTNDIGAIIPGWSGNKLRYHLNLLCETGTVERDARRRPNLWRLAA